MNGKEATAKPVTPEKRGELPRWWSFRVASGIRAGVLLPMLRRHRFRISWSRIHIALGVIITSLFATLPAWSQRWRYDAKVMATPIPPPIFIVGHWRSGTTYLHELLATDKRFIAPTYLQTFATDICLRASWLIRRLGVFLPARRPMDDVAAGWDRPQEDEFGLLAIGVPSPYEAILFPNDRPNAMAHLDISAMSTVDQQGWREALLKVMRRVAFAAGERATEPDTHLLLKSPTHTSRIGTLRAMFPDARFIHVTRDPHAIHASTEHLWERMFETHGFQKPRYDGALELTGFVSRTMEELYRTFDDDIASLPASSFAETRFDDLVNDPVGEITRLRTELGLPEADHDALRKHLEAVSGHRRNQFATSEDAKRRIREDWAWYFDRFGYDPDRPVAS